MNKVTYSKRILARNRNGSIWQTGITAYTEPIHHHIRITPLIRKEIVSDTAYLDIPREHLSEFIGVLQELQSNTVPQWQEDLSDIPARI